MIAPKQIDPNTVQAREGIVLGDLALYSIAEVEAAAEDSARIDWLERNRRALNAHFGTEYGWKVVRNHNVNRLFVHDTSTLDINDAEARGTDIRTAIDAARKEAL